MAEESTLDGARSIDTVIRGFTDAELALREVSSAVERIRSASEQLDAARSDQAAAREVLTEASGAIVTLGQRVEDLTHQFSDVRGLLAGLEPERLWQVLEDHSVALRHTGEQLDAQDGRIRRIGLLVWIGLAIGAVLTVLLGAVVTGLVP